MQRAPSQPPLGFRQSTVWPQQTGARLHHHVVWSYTQDVGFWGQRFRFCFVSWMSWQSRPDMGTCLGFVGLFYSSPGVNRPSEFEVTLEDGDGFSPADHGCCSAASFCFSQEKKNKNKTKTKMCTYTLGFGQVLLLFPLFNLTFLYYFLCKTIF